MTRSLSVTLITGNGGMIGQMLPELITRTERDIALYRATAPYTHPRVNEELLAALTLISIAKEALASRYGTLEARRAIMGACAHFTEARLAWGA